MNRKRNILFTSVLIPLYFCGCVNINFPGIWNGGGDDCGVVLPVPAHVYVVSGAGTGICDGTYVKDGSINEKPSYRKSGTACTIEYDMVKGWCIKDGCTVLYHCDVDETTPPESGEFDWLPYYGYPPVPVVSLEVGSMLIPGCY